MMYNDYAKMTDAELCNACGDAWILLSYLRQYTKCPVGDIDLAVRDIWDWLRSADELVREECKL